jgi:hypothetical protein
VGKTLISPGVSISVTDESFYDASTPGSVPLFVIATASNKVSPTGTGLAPWTLDSKAGQLFQATSQREVIGAFGNPIFYSSGGTPLHGFELNEYGLHGGYSFLGAASNAYFLRADIDLAQLESSDNPPAGEPLGGTFWLNPSDTSFGVFKSNGKAVAGEAWVPQTVLAVYEGQTSNVGGLDTPLTGVGVDGNFAVVVHTTNNYLFEKISGAWHKVGSTAWKAATPTVVTGTVSSPTLVIGTSFSINGTTVAMTGTSVAQAVTDINNAAIANINASNVSGALRITNATGNDIILANVSGTPLATLGMSAGTFKGNIYRMTNSIQYPTGSVAGDVWVKGSPTNRGAMWAVKVYSGISGTWQTVSAPFYAFNSAASDGDSGKDAAAETAFGAALAEGTVYVGFDASTGAMQLRRMGAEFFEILAYEASSAAPTSTPPAGALWYSVDFRTDVMVSDGDQWLGYKNVYPNTNPNGVFIAGSAPTKQSDGTALVQDDLWIDASALEEYPLMYRYDATAGRWKLIDLTDQTSPFGVIFADARANSGKQIGSAVHAEDSEAQSAMLASNFVDPDAPDPRTVPAGMLLFNTRYASYNVKRWEPNYFTLGEYDNNKDYTAETYTVGDQSVVFPMLDDAGRWVTISGNRADGSPFMGRKAQRAVIVKAMAAAVSASEDARSEIASFNLIAAPGYPELIDEMVTLNTDQGETAFIVSDAPARLVAESNAVRGWSTNAYGAASNGEDGLVSANPYLAVYYPWGLGENIDGAEVMIPPSTMALRTISYSDQIAYPWFAPAGMQRGLVTNATNVGYLDAEDEFRVALMSQGLKDTLYANDINPIVPSPSQRGGLVIMGQKTRSGSTTALDRINVSRLVCYLRVALDALMKPFLFEQNDDHTRDSAALTVDRFLNGLVGLRALQDYAVQCDTDNNTPERVDRNELWVDIAIKPTKAVEFIYVPIRITNQGVEL